MISTRSLLYAGFAGTVEYYNCLTLLNCIKKWNREQFSFIFVVKDFCSYFISRNKKNGIRLWNVPNENKNKTHTNTRSINIIKSMAFFAPSFVFNTDSSYTQTVSDFFFLEMLFSNLLCPHFFALFSAIILLCEQSITILIIKFIWHAFSIATNSLQSDRKSSQFDSMRTMWQWIMIWLNFHQINRSHTKCKLSSYCETKIAASITLETKRKNSIETVNVALQILEGTILSFYSYDMANDAIIGYRFDECFGNKTAFK